MSKRKYKRDPQQKVEQKVRDAFKAGATTVVTDTLIEEPPDNVRVIMDFKGWIPPEGKGWRLEKEMPDPDSLMVAKLWVRDQDL